MSGYSPLVDRAGTAFPWTVLRQQEEWGFATVDLVSPPRRLLGAESASLIIVEPGVDAKRVTPLATPARLLNALADTDNWQALSKRSIARFWAHFLICEDPQRRLDAREVSTLSHQVSLVRHILDHDYLRRVLIADEVGLGKTVEAGLLLKELLEAQPHLRILYLAPARLVTNVRREFDRLQLGFRQWCSADGDARLTDSRVIASIHRAVHPNHRTALAATEAWDVLLVDECHHLSDWADGGGDAREKFKLVRDLISRQRSHGRVILLSGTPHQGHMSRFENLVRLLQSGDESSQSLDGRVVYRTKDDIRDWNGDLLFPRRVVNLPLVVDLGPGYRNWISNIHEFFQPSSTNAEEAVFRRRAAGWRCAQALQWAASSPQAGLGYLVRQALRADWTLGDEPLEQCLLALRPYRGGSPQETAAQLFQRITKEVQRQRADADIEDIEEHYASNATDSAHEKTALRQLLMEGLAIVCNSPDEKWDFVWREILSHLSEEKTVLFAQPIETVTALAGFLKRVTGTTPALIIGGQSDAERDAEVATFCQVDGPRFLVSSRAGGEGINLQVARRLVHIDIPWNPMDMEQRVGRIHRFGSRRNVIIDTIVVKDSREADAYRIARERLHLIAATMVEPDRFESLFSRVICLMPPEELQDILINAPQAPLGPQDQAAIARMVQEGFKKWREFDQQFAAQQNKIRALNPGLATWQDVIRFLSSYAKAELAEDFVSQRFVERNGEVVSDDKPVEVLKLADGKHYACGDLGGAPVYGPGGEMAVQLGLNLKPVQEAIRAVAFPEKLAGAAYLRWPTDCELPSLVHEPSFALLVFLRHTVKTDMQTGWSEIGATLSYFIAQGTEEPAPLIEDEDRRRTCQGLTGAVIRAKPPLDMPLVSRVAESEGQIARGLQRPTESEFQSGVRHAVTPLLAAIFETAN